MRQVIPNQIENDLTDPSVSIKRRKKKRNMALYVYKIYQINLQVYALKNLIMHKCIYTLIKIKFIK